MRRRRRGKKIQRRRDWSLVTGHWSVDDLDAVDIRRRNSTKFDGAGVYPAVSNSANNIINDIIPPSLPRKVFNGARVTFWFISRTVRAECINKPSL